MLSVVWVFFILFAALMAILDFFLWRSAIADARAGDARESKEDLDRDLDTLFNIVLLPVLAPFWFGRSVYKVIKSYA